MILFISRWYLSLDLLVRDEKYLWKIGQAGGGRLQLGCMLVRQCGQL